MENILDFIEGENQVNKTFHPASKGKRFTNHLIDLIGYFTFSLLLGVFLSLASVASDSNLTMMEENTRSTSLMDWIWGMIVITIYYTLQEYFFKGKTLGKLITKTRAVTVDNQALGLKTAFIRSIIRVIPFEAFSFLGDSYTGWHDDWSNTKVIIDDGWI